VDKICGHGRQIRTMLLCGSDMFESFLNPNVWRRAHVKSILADFGVVVVQRAGESLPHSLISENGLFSAYKHNIFCVEVAVNSSGSSSKVGAHTSLRVAVSSSRCRKAL
jgi:nicotinic acid mononucleotide adenylyltransferase